MSDIYLLVAHNDNNKLLESRAYSRDTQIALLTSQHKASTHSTYVEHDEEHEKSKARRAKEEKKQSTLRHVLLRSCEIVWLLAKGNFMAKVPAVSGSESIINVYDFPPSLSPPLSLLLCGTCQ